MFLDKNKLKDGCFGPENSSLIFNHWNDGWKIRKQTMSIIHIYIF
jgi:hypothetical protein